MSDNGAARGPTTAEQWDTDETGGQPDPPDVLPDTSLLRRGDRNTQRNAQHSGNASESRSAFNDAAGATRHEWQGTWHSSWEDRSSQTWGNGWDASDRYGADSRAANWTRRSSWDDATTTTGGATMEARPWDSRGVDPWMQGGDPWSSRRADGPQDRPDGRRDHGQAPQADGRAASGQGSDPGDHRGGQWSSRAASDDTGMAWSGWTHYENGGFHNDGYNRRGTSGGGKASERLAVPTFNGDDSEDLGGSARSYLRQIEAWRRMTSLPISQQGLVLYQNLSGKAWIAAEELSVPRLASDDGVSYLVSWVSARFLDLEVARIGRAFSDFFRRLRRRPGQSIREYNTEYDRLHARLREVGCSLPQECAAWLYVDRLQLEEPQELNLLASVGNEYNLLRLQQAAVLHDRGHRKPWETTKGRKTHTAHMTCNGDEDDEQAHEGYEDAELEDGVPEEVAIAFATYQSAKDRYKDSTKARGYQGDKAGQSSAPNKDRARAAELSREEKVKIMKAKSFCSSCGQKGHWHKDAECPNQAAQNVSVCHHVPAEVYSLRHEGKTLVGITDTACAKAVAGTMWLQQYSDVLALQGVRPELVRESEAFRFGTGKIHHSAFHVVICFALGNRTVEMKTSIINGDVPLLLSKRALAQLGMVYDIAANCADFKSVNLQKFELITTSSGHPAIPIIPSRPTGGPDRLVLDDSESKSSEQYTAFAVSFVRGRSDQVDRDEARGSATSTATTTSSLSTTTSKSTFDTQAPHYKIFYDKKLPPALKELLTLDRLQSASFLGWWEGTSITSDFWLESEFAWHRIHVTPRRVPCNPSTWKTQATVQKDMLIRSISDLRVTEGFCCRTGKPLEIAVDRWTDGSSEHAYSLLWIGRSTFAKRSSSNNTFLRERLCHGRMEADPDQPNVQDGAPRGGEPVRTSGAPQLVVRRNQGDNPGAPDERPERAPLRPDEVGHQLEHARAQDEGEGVGSGFSVECDERESVATHPRQLGYAGHGAHEDREVQGLGVRRDPEPVRDVGGTRGPDERQPPHRASPLREVVGVRAAPHPLRDPYRGRCGGAVPLGGESKEHGIGSELALERSGERLPVANQAQQEGYRVQPRTGRAPHPLDREVPRQPELREDEQASVLECELRQGDHGGDGIRGRSFGPGGDQGPREQACGPEGQGEVRGDSVPEEEVKDEYGSPDGNPAPSADRNHSRDRRDERDCPLPGLYYDGPGAHGGQVHSAPARGDLRPRGDHQNYKFVGCHFGNKTGEHRKGCCERDADTYVNDTFISELDLQRAKHNEHRNFQCGVEDVCASDHIKNAIAEQDYSYGTLKRLLEEAGFTKVKTTRDGILGEGSDWANYHTVGLFSHGGVYGVTNRTKDHQSLVRYINLFGKHHLGSGATWSSVTVSLNAAASVRHDFHNHRGARNYTVSFGQKTGGGLWIEDRTVQEDQLPKGIKWRQAGGGHWLPGRVVDTCEQFYEFDPFHKHATEPWTGDRWCLTYHTTRNIVKAGSDLKNYLKKCGFPLPKGARTTTSTTSGKKPTPSTRKTIFNNAAKLAVLMTTLMSAARSYMTTQVLPTVQADPVVLFEIGGTSGTEEAVKFGKDVFEPMSWERYRSPQGKLDAYHVINGGAPRELRLHLAGKASGCDEALADLIHLQVKEGGSIVIYGNVHDSIFQHNVFKNDVAEHVQHKETIGDELFLVIFQEKDDVIKIEGADRVHGVCAVEHGNAERELERPILGGAGITFNKDVAPSVATALRRLHQNLGHPQQGDLVRHLRLAGCDAEIVKAAKSMRCQVCEANAAPKIARPSTIPHLFDWNDTLGIDLFFAHDSDDRRHTFLSVVDFGTTYHLAAQVDGQSADDIEAKFNEMWILPFGPPKSVAIDLETGLQAALGRLCDWHGIGVRSVATQSHWQAGMVERQQAWWKAVWERVVYQLSITEEDVAIAVPIINSAKNDLRRRCGYSPSQWVFGKDPRTPEELQDPDGGNHVLWDVTQDARYQRQSAVRAAARVAFHESQNDSRLRKALIQRTRVTSRPYDIGETVHYWHKPKNRRRGEWSGPAIIVGKEGGNYWISKGGRCRLTSPEHMRPTTPEEVGSFLAMKNTKKEVEFLLEYDPDADETYEADAYEDMEIEEDEGHGVGEVEFDDEDVVLEPIDEEDEALLPVPTRRLKRKTAAAELNPDRHEALMLRTDLTRRGVEKRKEKELKWAEIPEAVRDKFREAERQQWREHLDFDALEPLSTQASDEVRARVLPERILRCRWAYKDKNYARRREGEDLPWKCKSRLVIAGHTDPDLTNEGLHLSTDAPTLSRSGFSCLMQITANGLKEEDPWTMSAGDIRCAFLTGSYLSRELFMHQPRTGFPDMLPGQLVRIKKNVFGLATSPHEWWIDLQNGFFSIKIEVYLHEELKTAKFQQCPLDPCIFMLRLCDGEEFYERPVAYVGCHVDDLLVAGPRTISEKIQRALSTVFPIDEWIEGEFDFLGSRVKVDEDGIRVSQEKYASTRLFQIEIPKGVDDDDPAPAELISDNRSLIGALSWMSAQSRPDLTCSVSMSQQLQKAPTYGDIRFTNSVANKAQLHKHRGLHYKGIPRERMMFIVYHDAAWANVPEADPLENYYVLTPEEDQAGLQREGPYSAGGGARKAKRSNSKVASQLGLLVVFADRVCLSGGSGDFSIADWKSQAGQRVCRSTFGAETQACVEGVENAQYFRSMYESLMKGALVPVDEARSPILCLSDCRSLYDHLNRQGVPRVPSDKRLAVDLAALRQCLKTEMWGDSLPIGWLPGQLQKADVLTKPQNPTEWWDATEGKLVLPLAVAGGAALINDRKIRERTSVKLNDVCTRDGIGVFPYEHTGLSEALHSPL